MWSCAHVLLVCTGCHCMPAAFCKGNSFSDADDVRCTHSSRTRVVSSRTVAPSLPCMPGPSLRVYLHADTYCSTHATWAEFPCNGLQRNLSYPYCAALHKRITDLRDTRVQRLTPAAPVELEGGHACCSGASMHVGQGLQPPKTTSSC